MEYKSSVRIMRSEIRNFKNVNYGKVSYMNCGSINKRGIIDKTDMVGIYGQNGSGKTALVESLDILKCIIKGAPIPYETYGGILSRDNPVSITTDFFVERESLKYKVNYVAYLRANDEQKKIEIYKEKLTYWTRGNNSWKAERDLEFENPYYDNTDLLSQKELSIVSNHKNHLKSIPFLASMQNLALICAQQFVSVFFNFWVLRSSRELEENEENIAFRDVVNGMMQFGMVDLNVIKVNQLGTINYNQMIPINVHRETESAIIQECIELYISEPTEIEESYFPQVQATISAINIALQSIIPNLQIELEKKMEKETPDGTKTIQVDVYSKRDNKRFLIRYESEGIKRIISILNYLIAVFNNAGVCLVVDEMDSGIFEYLLGELLGLMNKEMKGQLIFTSHNLRVLEKLDSKNIVCSTVNPDNRYIRLVGVEKNNNKRDFYIRAITVGGQKEVLYDDEDLIAMGYAFRKAANVSDKVNLTFSAEFQEKLEQHKK
ncbi:MAG: ATP-binding protein [Lachnospiraceae bacterium]|nr:ATP-binding protein [Lachnospiraceae bacterium]